MSCYVNLLPTCLYILFFFVGCRKETVEDQESVWQQVSTIRNESKIILNASTDGQQLYTYGPYTLNITDCQLSSRTFIHGANSLNIPPANGKILGYFLEDRNIFYITSYKALQSGLNAAAISLSEISANASMKSCLSQP